MLCLTTFNHDILHSKHYVSNQERMWQNGVFLHQNSTLSNGWMQVVLYGVWVRVRVRVKGLFALIRPLPQAMDMVKGQLVRGQGRGRLSFLFTHCKL